MTRFLATVAALAVCAGFATPAFCMGGSGGYGGGGMGMGGSSAIKLDDYSMALRNIHREKYADAIPYLERALEDRPHSADILNYLGYTNRMVGNYQLSLAWYRKALAEDPDHKGAHEYLGELYLNLHDLASAQGQLAELARLCPDSCDERDTLTKSIADYVAANPAMAAPSTASTAPVTPPATPATPAATTPTAAPAAQPASGSK